MARCCAHPHASWARQIRGPSRPLRCRRAASHLGDALKALLEYFRAPRALLLELRHAELAHGRRCVARQLQFSGDAALSWSRPKTAVQQNCQRTSNRCTGRRAEPRSWRREVWPDTQSWLERRIAARTREQDPSSNAQRRRHWSTHAAVVAASAQCVRLRSQFEQTFQNRRVYRPRLVATPGAGPPARVQRQHARTASTCKLRAALRLLRQRVPSRPASAR